MIIVAAAMRNGQGFGFFYRRDEDSGSFFFLLVTCHQQPSPFRMVETRCCSQWRINSSHKERDEFKKNKFTLNSSPCPVVYGFYNMNLMLCDDGLLLKSNEEVCGVTFFVLQLYLLPLHNIEYLSVYLIFFCWLFCPSLFFFYSSLASSSFLLSRLMLEFLLFFGSKNLMMNPTVSLTRALSSCSLIRVLR